MNRTTLSPALLILLSLSLLLTSCGSERSEGPAIVTGQLPDLASKEIKCKINGREYKTTADTLGWFRMALDITRPQYPRFRGINEHLYLLPGDSLFIAPADTAGTGKPGDLEYSGGESGLINNYYLLIYAHLRSLLDTVNIKWYYSQEAAPFSELVGRLISEWTGMLEYFAAENPGIGREFISLEKERIRHYWYYELNAYQDEYNAYTGKAPELPGDFYDYLETVSLNDTMLFMFPGYRFFLYSWIDLQERLAEKTWSGYGQTHHFLDIAENNFSEAQIRKNVVWEIMKKQVSRIKVDEEAIARAERLGLGDKQMADIRKHVGIMQPLSAGYPAMEFEILDVEGKAYSLKDFSGKYLLIDVWSTTCSPCVREMPRLHDIQLEMEGRNLETITVCLSDEDPWKKKLEELGLPAEGQYRAEKGWSSQFKEDYVKFTGVPAYIIIDPEGKIVTGRAPYPSKGLKEVLEELPI